ncbi:MAG: hypothetical protein RR554_07040 [Vagococcus sp.]|uniref:hypothetical protein n=1 Tax=Vagococcus sp. TaxID=1933889 RepID=UPI002FC65C59
MNEMKQLFFLDWKYRNFKASSFANGLFYFLGRIPLLGKIVPTTMLYREYGLKKGIAALKLIGSILFSFFWYGLPFVISLFISKGLSHVTSSKVSILFVWLMLFNVIGICLLELFPNLERQEIQFITNFRVSKEDYIKKSSLLKIIKTIIFSLPGLIIVGIIEKQVVLSLLIGTFSLLSFSLIWSVINLHLTLFNKRLLIKILTVIVIISIDLTLGYFLIKNDLLMSFQKLTVSWLGAFVCLMLWLPFLYLYVHFKRFSEYTRQMFISSEVLINYSESNKKDQQYYLGEGKKMKLEKVADDEKVSSLTGSKYLNALLFNRFRTSLRKQLMYRVVGISLVMLAIVVFSLLAPIKIEPIKVEKLMYNFMPIMFFVLYILSFGKSVVQTLFVNCDSSMLAYPFYRESKAIVQGFFYRFLKTFYYNGVIGTTIYLWFLIFNGVNNQLLSLEFSIIFFFVILSLTILFSFHELFIYYILQPFTSDFQVKNPVYKLVDGIFYFIAYISLQIKTAEFSYAAIVSGISILYFVIGLIVIVKVAPKTFKLKN